MRRRSYVHGETLKREKSLGTPPLEVVRALADGTPLHVFPDPHSKQLATIMRPFLTKVVEGGDVYNRG